MSSTLKVKEYGLRDKPEVLNPYLKVDSTKVFMENLKFKKSDSSEFSFSEVKGKVILLDFWATWCGPCRKQHPYVEDLLENVNDPNFEIITISVDRNIADWERFFEKNNWKGINIYVGWDSENPLFKMVLESIGQKNGETLFKVSVPQYYLIDRSLNIEKLNDIKSKEVEKKIQSLLAK